MKNNKWLKNVFKYIGKTILFILSIVISALFCLNANIFWGNLGFLNTQIELADDARLNNEYNESITWYNKIVKNDSDYAPYAHLAMAEIYSLELANKNYDKALEEYKCAISGSDDVQILNSAMHFILQQITFQNDKTTDFAIDFLDNENINFVVDVMNRLNETDPKRFSSLPIDFPIEKNDIRYIFSPETKYEEKTYTWEYVSTITDYRSNLAYINDTEKVILVDSWEEILEPLTSFAPRTVYKYYRYNKVETENYEISPIIAIQRILDPQKPIPLKELYFK